MKKTVVAILLGILLIGTFGAMVVSAATSNDVKTNYGYCSGLMQRWADRCTGSGDYGGNSPYCSYFDSDKTTELKVKTIDEAFEIAKVKIDNDISKENIYQMGCWWIVSYKDKNGLSSQARINSATGEVFTEYSVPSGPQTCGMQASSFGYWR